MAAIPTTEPKAFVAGDTVQWTKTLSEYPAPDWTLTYHFRGPSSHDIAATPQDASHAVTISAADSAQWNAGDYWYSARVTKGTEAFTLGRDEVLGKLTVMPNLADPDRVYDGRTPNERILDAITATIEKRATSDQLNYSIAGRSLGRTPMDQLIKLQERYEGRVARDKRRGQRKILVRI